MAAAGTAAVLLALWLGGVLGGGLGGRPHLVLDYLSPASHVIGFQRGTLAVSDLTYFASMALAGLAVAWAVLRTRR